MYSATASWRLLEDFTSSNRCSHRITIGSEYRRKTKTFLPKRRAYAAKTFPPHQIYIGEIEIIKTTNSLENEFNSLLSKWKLKTGMLSIRQQKFMHPSYQQIIGMGEAALPFIFRELESNPSNWFWALEAITRQRPTEGCSSVSEATEAWKE